MVTSTPNMSREGEMQMSRNSDVSIINRSLSLPILISDSSVSEPDGATEVKEITCDCWKTPVELEGNVVVNTNNLDFHSNSTENVKKNDSGEMDTARGGKWEASSKSLHKESIASSVESVASDAARARCLESKLMATMLILKNKEETIRVQAESLSLAEARIAALNAKCSQPGNKMHQAQQTNSYSTMKSSTNDHPVEMTDVGTAVEDSKIVKTLRENLSMIEEFYRECFYETAKQEELITMLRRSYLDMKLVDRQKSDQIDFLQNSLKSQKKSIDRYEDIAAEVESVKADLLNTVNNSTNNDSGVWGCAATARVLPRDITNWHATECICGLEEENKNLKQRNESMEIQIGELRQRVIDLETELQDKENMDQNYHKLIGDKEKELHHIRQQLLALEQGSREQGTACDMLTFQLRQLEASLSDKTSELLNTQQRCVAQEETIRDLREELHKTDLIVSENRQVRSEVSSLAAQVAQWRAQLAACRARLRGLEHALRRATEHCRRLAAHYRRKASAASALQAQLAEAQQHGALLSAEAQRAVRCVRRSLTQQRARRRAQDDKIREQVMTIRQLRSAAGRPSASENEPSCSKYVSRAEGRGSDPSCLGASETVGCSRCAYPRGLTAPSSESCASPPPPAPPRRLLRRKPLCTERYPVTREAGVQRPPRHDVQTDTRISSEHLHFCDDTPSRESPRVQRAAAAGRRGGSARLLTEEDDV